MNSIGTLYRVELYLDVTRNARYQKVEIDSSVRDAMRIYIDNIIDDYSDDKRNITQGEQTISDELYTLQRRQSTAPTADIALFPADYYNLLDIFATINGISTYCRPLNQNKLGPRLADAFDSPSANTPFYLQQTTGFQIYYSGVLTNVDLDYYKIPVDFTVGTDSQLIPAGGTLVAGSSYIATQVSVENAITYNIGTQFTAATTVLTSGEVILASNTVPIELPPRAHEAVAKIAASILGGAVSDFPKSQFASQQTDKS